jgi:hypothetical protein
MVHDQSHGSVRIEYELPRQKKVRDAAGGVDVCAVIDRRPAKGLLRRNIRMETRSRKRTRGDSG